MPGFAVRGINHRYSSILSKCISDIHKYSNFPARWDCMTCKLMIRCCFCRGSKLMSVWVEASAPCGARNFAIRPRIDLKINEEEPVGVEEEKDFVKPVKDLCGFIRSRRPEIAFLRGA